MTKRRNPAYTESFAKKRLSLTSPSGQKAVSIAKELVLGQLKTGERLTLKINMSYNAYPS